jgi:CDP-6-deoxy-D-xylo-4-hexulose-3-dehydrase
VFYLLKRRQQPPSWFGFLLTIKPGVPFKRIDIIQYLKKINIQTRLLFAGNLIKHPCFDLIRSEENAIIELLEI